MQSSKCFHFVVWVGVVEWNMEISLDIALEQIIGLIL